MRDVRVTSPASRRARLIAVACALAPATARAQVAPADSREQIGVLEVATSGLSEAAGDKFEQGVEETLADSGLRVVRSNTVKKSLLGTSYMSGCTFGPCLKEVFTRTGLRRVLVARIQGAGQSYSFIISLVDTESGQLISQVATPCPACTVDEAIKTATEAVGELLNRGEEVAPPAMSAMQPVAPSPSADTARIDARDQRRQRQLRRAGWIFIAAGVVAGGLGGGLIAADETDAGVASAALGGGFAVAGITALVWSGSF